MPEDHLRLAGTLALIVCAVVTALTPVTAQEPPSKPTFDEFLDGVRAEALSKGVRPAAIDAAFAGLTLEPVVVARDRAQPEQATSLETYLSRRITPRLIADARVHAERNRQLLARVEQTYGVPPAVMTAVWGLESSFGKFTGTYPTVRALATLAYDGRRALFRTELLDALAIIDRGDATMDRLTGSWAGAMGQPQFMPSTFLRHAVDFDGDGRPNIWSSTADVFASMANYLAHSGWKADLRWGREVAIGRTVMTRIDREVPMRTTGCRAERAMTLARPLAEWRELGVTLPGGAPLPNAAVDAALVRGTRRNFLVYGNYGALLAYNCSNSYAVSVGILADRIGP